MRISSFSALLTTAAGQYNPTEPGGLEKIVADVREKCWNYIDTALSCEPPASKASKMKHRIGKVLDDAIWHESRGKCAPSAARRRRSDDDSSSSDSSSSDIELYIDYADDLDDLMMLGLQRAGSSNLKLINRLQAQCSKFVEKFVEAEEIAYCGKQGAWKKRIEFLVEVVGIMKNICLKAHSDSSGY